MSSTTTRPHYPWKQGDELFADELNAAIAAASSAVAAGGPFLSLSGGTMGGSLILNADPTVALGAATRQYVLSSVSSGISTGTVTSFNARAGIVTLSNTDVTTVLPPSSTTPVMDGTATIGSGTTWARSDHIHPTDTSRYAAANPSGYQTAAQVQAAVAPALNNVGRNLIHNPLFNVAQRGAGPFTATVAGIYTADRWSATIGAAGDSNGVTIVALTDGHRAAIGDESAIWTLSSGFAGGAGATNFIYLRHPVENVRRLAGKTVTVSFWANASAVLQMGVNNVQVFGTGGSPSASVILTPQAVTLTTTFSRYSLTFNVPSVSGKTFGTTAGSDYHQLEFWLSSGSALAGRAGVGVQSGTINIWGVQLEIGSVMTPLEKPDPQQDLAKCQRFAYPGTFRFTGYQAAGAGAAYNQPLPVVMRAQPTVTPSYSTQTNCAGTVAAWGNDINIAATVTALGAFVLIGTFLASADL